MVTPALTKAPWPIQTSGPMVVIGQLVRYGRLRAWTLGAASPATMASQPYNFGVVGGARGGQPVGRVLVRADRHAARHRAVAADPGVVEAGAAEAAEGADVEEGVGRHRGDDRGRALDARARREGAGVAQAGQAEADGFQALDVGAAQGETDDCHVAPRVRDRVAVRRPAGLRVGLADQHLLELVARGGVAGVELERTRLGRGGGGEVAGAALKDAEEVLVFAAFRARWRQRDA